LTAGRAGRAALAGVLVVVIVVATYFLMVRWQAAERDRSMPRYRHIFVIIAENEGYHELIDDPQRSPAIHRLAADYGSAAQFYAEVHPSEGDYVAILGGDTFGIHDDDAFYCRPGLKDAACPGSDQRDYANHDIHSPSLMDQLAAKGLSWKAYMEDVPASNPLMPIWPAQPDSPKGFPSPLYASKHNAFLNFASINEEPRSELVRHVVGFDQLDADLDADTMPNFAEIVPNECDDMHGLVGNKVPVQCKLSNLDALVRRGDAEIGALVAKIIHSKVWSDPGNAAIVVTFDEAGESKGAPDAKGCCGFDPNSVANFGGGHIPTVVITNHGPRHFVDATPYNHYSLLRTIEAAFGIEQHLGHAADTADGVVTMTPLFVTKH
jgi:hypothetical protein